MKLLIALLVTLLFAGCASSQKSDDIGKPIYREASTDKSARKSASMGYVANRGHQSESFEEEINVDLEGLQRHLNFYRSSEKLGYAEKFFSTCDVGYGYSGNTNCRKEYFILINFQLFCRHVDSDTYTAALNKHDMRPIAQKTVNWTLQNQKGELNLDNRGFGQIRTTARGSLRSQRLKLVIENGNLHIRAGEVTKVVTPAEWCY